MFFRLAVSIEGFIGMTDFGRCFGWQMRLEQVPAEMSLGVTDKTGRSLSDQVAPDAEGILLLTIPGHSPSSHLRLRTAEPQDMRMIEDLHIQAGYRSRQQPESPESATVRRIHQ